MNQIKFPIINITDKWFNLMDTDECIRFDPYFYSSSEKLYKKHCYHKVFCDSEGFLFEVIGKEKKQSGFFRIIPIIHKQTLVFKSLNKQIELNDLKNFVLNNLTELENNPLNSSIFKDLKQKIEKAESFKEVMNC